MSISEPMHLPEPVRRIELFTGTGRRRSWSANEKAAIVAESYEPGESVCAVARRHGLTPQQLFTWRRIARRDLAQGEEPRSALFVPAVVRIQPEPPSTSPPRSRRTGRRRSARAGIELEINGGVVRIGPEASEVTITAVIRALRTSS